LYFLVSFRCFQFFIVAFPPFFPLSFFYSITRYCGPVEYPFSRSSIDFLSLLGFLRFYGIEKIVSFFLYSFLPFSSWCLSRFLELRIIVFYLGSSHVRLRCSSSKFQSSQAFFFVFLLPFLFTLNLSLPVWVAEYFLPLPRESSFSSVFPSLFLILVLANWITPLWLD